MIKPRYDLPAPWSTSDTLPFSSRTSFSSGSMNWYRWYTCLSLRRLSWFSLPSRVRICSSCSSATDWPGRISGMSVMVAGTGAAGALLRFIDPRLLDRFQDFFAAALVVVVEAVQRHDPVMQVRKADRGGVQVRIFVVQRFGNRGDVGPFHDELQAQWPPSLA